MFLFLLILCFINVNTSEITSSHHECPLSQSAKITQCTRDPDLQNYNCECKYSDGEALTSNCLIASVGMAVKGYNLIYKQWVNKENCFNLCLGTTVKNGFNFDCKSFEHWHGDCTGHTAESPCASFSNDHGLARRNHRHHNLNSKRATTKLDYCVLSNQTIKTAGYDFTENNAVTYYEILCGSTFNHRI